jgi:NADH-quinone oxidoreductase subunit M
MLGIPPLAGFAARWQLYETAIGIGPVFLGALLLATALSVLAYSRALVLCWWGPAPAERSGKGEPALLVAAMVGLCLILLAIGLWPPIWSM